MEPRLPLGLSIEVLWFDEDLCELRIRAANDRFAAEVDCYADHLVLQRLAAALRGFPSTPDDRRCFVVGEEEGPSMRLTARCGDALGHAAVDLRIQGDRQRHLDADECAAFSIPVEAGAIDSFVDELARTRLVAGAAAYLPARG